MCSVSQGNSMYLGVLWCHWSSSGVSLWLWAFGVHPATVGVLGGKEPTRKFGGHCQGTVCTHVCSITLEVVLYIHYCTERCVVHTLLHCTHIITLEGVLYIQYYTGRCTLHTLWHSTVLTIIIVISFTVFGYALCRISPFWNGWSSTRGKLLPRSTRSLTARNSVVLGVVSKCPRRVGGPPLDCLTIHLFGEIRGRLLVSIVQYIQSSIHICYGYVYIIKCTSTQYKNIWNDKEYKGDTCRV